MSVTSRRRLVKGMVSAGWLHREVAAHLGVTMRTVGRDVAADLPDPEPAPASPTGGACESADPDTFFPDSGGADDALRICLDLCPVLERCAAFAVECDAFNVYGVVGGLTPNDRRQFRRGEASVAELHAANRERLGLAGAA